MVVGIGAKESTRWGFCLARAFTKSSHLSPLSFSMFQRSCAVLLCREGSGMANLPCHLAWRRSSKLFGTSPDLTSSVLYRTPTGVTRHGVTRPSFSLYFAGKLSEEGGTYLAKTFSRL